MAVAGISNDRARSTRILNTPVRCRGCRHGLKGAPVRGNPFEMFNSVLPLPRTAWIVADATWTAAPGPYGVHLPRLSHVCPPRPARSSIPAGRRRLSPWRPPRTSFVAQTRLRIPGRRPRLALNADPDGSGQTGRRAAPSAGGRVPPPGRPRSFIQMTFETFGLAPGLLRALSAAGYTVPTPIQARAIPAALGGRDILGAAQTGTGKTAAYAVPLLQKLAGGAPANGRHGPRALVLVPTRELAVQVADSLKAY